MPKFRIVATYPGDLSVEYDRLLFAAVSSIIGGNGYSSGSGYHFELSIRDHEWFVETKELAEALRNALLLLSIPALTVNLIAPKVSN